MAFNWKTATSEDRKIECKRIAMTVGDDQFFTKKELNYLPEVLADGEQVLSFVSGIYDKSTWLIVLTDRRLLLLNKGILFGLKQTSIDLSKVYTVSGTTGLLFGKITVDAGEKHIIDNVLKGTVIPFTNKVRDQLEVIKDHKQSSPPVVAATNASTVDQLERLAALKERGLLTEAEFAEQKAKLLSA